MSLNLLKETTISSNYWLIRRREFSAEEYPEIDREMRKPFGQHEYRIPHVQSKKESQMSNLAGPD
jgi:hypothetical protein